MKNVTILVALAVLLATAGCSTLNQVQARLEKYKGSGSITVESPLQLTTAVVENADNDGDNFTADKIDIVHKGKITGGRVEIHLTDYSRSLIDAESDS